MCAYCIYGEDSKAGYDAKKKARAEKDAHKQAAMVLSTGRDEAFDGDSEVMTEEIENSSERHQDKDDKDEDYQQPLDVDDKDDDDFSEEEPETVARPSPKGGKLPPNMDAKQQQEDEDDGDSRHDITKLSNMELKDMASDMGLSKSGNKAELVNRITEEKGRLEEMNSTVARERTARQKRKMKKLTKVLVQDRRKQILEKAKRFRELAEQNRLAQLGVASPEDVQVNIAN